MIYVFLAEGFEEIEAIAPVDTLRRAGADVKTVGIGTQTVKSVRGISINADISEDEAVFDNLEMVILPGGGLGVENLGKSETVAKFINFAVENNLFIGAICAAPSILGEMDILKGRNCVCFPGFEDKIKGANILNESVCIDGKFITAKGAGVSIEFALTLVEVLFGKEMSEKIKNSIQCG